MIVLFAGVVLVPVDFEPRVVAIGVRVVGWIVILAALGVVEVLMALYYRMKRSRAGHRQLP